MEDNKKTNFKDILTEDDRLLLEDDGKNLDILPLQIKVPSEEDLEGDFDGE